MDVTLFPEQFIRFKELLIEGEMYYIGGRVKERDGRLQLILNSMSAINLKKYWILLENHEHDQAVAEIIDQFPGDVPILIHYQETKETLQVQNKSVEVSSQLEQALKEFVVKTVYQ